MSLLGDLQGQRSQDPKDLLQGQGVQEAPGSSSSHL